MESTASCSDPDYITKNNTRVVLSPLLMSASLSPTIKNMRRPLISNLGLRNINDPRRDQSQSVQKEGQKISGSLQEKDVLFEMFPIQMAIQFRGATDFLRGIHI